MRFVLFFKQKTADEMRISDWSSDVCSSDLRRGGVAGLARYTGGDRAAGRERFELGHLFDRRVADGFVHLQAFGLDDLAIESTFLLCDARAAMRFERERLHAITRDAHLFRDHLPAGDMRHRLLANTTDQPLHYKREQATEG